MLHPNDVATLSHERALKPFKKLEEPEPQSGENAQCDFYDVVVKALHRFYLCICFVPCRTVFRMSFQSIECTQVESGRAAYGGCSDVTSSDYTLVLCAFALHIISEVL